MARSAASPVPGRVLAVLALAAILRRGARQAPLRSTPGMAQGLRPARPRSRRRRTTRSRRKRSPSARSSSRTRACPAPATMACVDLPRSGPVLLRRRRAPARPRRRAPAAAHAVAVEPRLGPDLLLGRARAEPRGAGERADREHAARWAATSPRRRRALPPTLPCASAFAAAFPDDPARHRGPHRAALASFERTLVSPETRFDRWVEGDDGGPRRRTSVQALRSSSARRAASPATRAGASPTRPSTTSACRARTADAARS